MGQITLVEEPFWVTIRVAFCPNRKKTLLQIPKEENGMKPKDKLFFFFHFE